MGDYHIIGNHHPLEIIHKLTPLLQTSPTPFSDNASPRHAHYTIISLIFRFLREN